MIYSASFFFGDTCVFYVMCAHVCAGAFLRQGLSLNLIHHFCRLAGQGASEVLLSLHPQHQGYKHM